MCPQIPQIPQIPPTNLRLVHLSLEPLGVSSVTHRSRDINVFLIDLNLAHRSLVLWRKCDVQEAAERHFSWKKEVMFFDFVVHQLTSKDWNLVPMYEITKFKCILNWAWHCAIAD